jgi:hypothetical protein
MKMRLELRKTDIEDWYVIEWLDAMDMPDAEVEGQREHKVGLARAILKRDAYREKRCAVDARGKRVRFWSPRNSRGQEGGAVDQETAYNLAVSILKTLGE